MEAANRKLIRPIYGSKERPDPRKHSAPQGPPMAKKSSPPESTNAENFYYAKQIQLKTPMVIVLRDGEQVSGVIEWYDKACLKVVADGGTPMMLYKPAIKYMYKSER